jgi:hypothetical protein
MGRAGAEWTDRRLNDLAAALEHVPARVAVLEATVDHLEAELDSVPVHLAVLAATVDRLADENRVLRGELATTQRHLLQMYCGLIAATLGGAAAIIAALI